MELIECINKLEKSKIKAGDGEKVGKYPLYTCSPKVNKFCDYYLYNTEAIILGTGGNPVINYHKGEFSYSTDCLAIQSKGEFENKYLYYYLMSKISDISKMFRGAGIKHLNKRELFQMNINLIDKKEQKIVVKNLDMINNVIELKKKQLEELDIILKSQFVEMFGDPKINQKEWKKTYMEEYIDVLTDFSANGSYTTLDSKVVMYDEPNYAYMVRTIDLENKDYKNNIKYITKEVYEFLSKSKVYPNDIIMNKIGSAGKVYIMPDLDIPVSLGRNAFLIRFNDKILPYFIYFLLISEYGTNQIQRSVRGAVTKTITKEDVRKIKIIVPPITLQNRFSEIVKQIDKQKFEIEKSLRETQELYESLMEKYFG